MEKTISNSKAYFTYKSVMAAMFCVLLFVGLLHSHAGATSEAPDIKLNGMDDLITLTPDSTLSATVQLDAGEQAGEQADWWIIADTSVGWFYYEDPGMWRYGGADAEDIRPAFQDALYSITEPLEILNITGLPAGSYVFYFAVDRTVNARVDIDSLFYDRAAVNVVAAEPYGVVDTGQTKCYNSNGREITCPAQGEAFYGQDAQHTGNVPGFTNNGDGTITDNVTGLMWQQSPDVDGDGDIDADDKMTYDQAVAGAGALSLGAYNDWRLPTIKELYSLIDFRGIDPSGYEGSDLSGLVPFIDTAYFDFAYGDTGAGERIIDSQYASGNLYVSTTGNNGGRTMFGVNFADGRIKGYGLSLLGSEKKFFVIYVRGNTSHGLNNFTDNGDGTITDSATSLMWARNDSAAGLNWEEGLAWVQTKNAENYLGYSDWRMPNVKELQGIVDYTRSPDTTGSAAIDSLFNSTAVTNEAGRADYPYYWSSTTHTNWTNAPGPSGAYVAFGRAMGYMQGSWIDVHGAGAQRSDPKSGNPADYPTGHGPQGDAIRIYNYVRLVRDADVTRKTDVYVSRNDFTCGGNNPCYLTIQEGIDAVDNESAVNIAKGTYNEALTMNLAKTMTLNGGWNDAFTIQETNSTITRALNVGNGTLIMRNIVLMETL